MKRVFALAVLLAAGHVMSQQPQAPDLPNITVKFPDGTSVPVKLRQWQDFWMPDPTQSGTENVKRLEPLARGGDMGAAFGIYRFLDDCHTAPTSEAQLTRWITDLKSRRLLTWEEGRTTSLPPESKLDQYEKNYRDKYRQCRGLQPADFKAAGRWLRMAADGGHYWALVYLSQENDPTRTAEQKLAIDRKRWEFGDAGALDLLARDLEDVNRVESVGHYLLFTQIQKALGDLPNQQGAKMMAEQWSRSLDQKLQELTPPERKHAGDLAKEVLLKNKRCCYKN